MNLADTLRGLVRRWYIVIPGLLVAVAVAIAAWQLIKPTYERTGTQLLLPGTASIPEAGNPYLYLGGLSQAADVLVTAMSSENELGPILEDHPGAEIVVSRDPMTSGPQVLTTVTARSDAEAGEILAAVMVTTEDVLDGLQDVDGITAGNRIGIKTITQDTQSTLEQKNRMLGVAAAGLGVVVVTLVAAALIDGMSTRRRRRGSATGADEDEPEPTDDAVSADDTTDEADGSDGAEDEPVDGSLAEVDIDTFLDDMSNEEASGSRRTGTTTSRRTR